MARVWLLNLDAERELAASGSYETPKRLREQIAREGQRIEAALCAGEAVLHESASAARGAAPQPRERKPDEATGTAIAWCPTPHALRRARAAGLQVPRAPSVEVLRRVNHRSFALEVAKSPELTHIYEELGPHRGATVLFEAERRFVTPASPEAADVSWLETTPRIGRGHRLKRSYGFAGKGQHRVTSRLQGDDRKWIREALAAGGFLVEPEVALLRELSLHGLVDEAGVLLGEPCELVCDQFGAPVTVRRAAPEGIPPSVREALVRAADALASALQGAGYWGPFGLDARLFDSAEGPGLTLIGDVNARFTMGWSIGLGDGREAALERLTSPTLRREGTSRHS